jgi:hypothetical protein
VTIVGNGLLHRSKPHRIEYRRDCAACDADGIRESVVIEPPKSKVIVNIQGLRAIAALLVVGRHVGNPGIGVETHFFPNEPSLLQPIVGTFGGIGIDIFFVISGFIMLTTTWGMFGKPGAGRTFFCAD